MFSDGRIKNAIKTVELINILKLRTNKLKNLESSEDFMVTNMRNAFELNCLVKII